MKSIQKYLPIIILVAVFFLVARIPAAQKGLEIFSDSLAEVSWEWREARVLHGKLTELLVSSKTDDTTVSRNTQDEELVVTEVVDGDTLRGFMNEKEVMVRLIGINAPETGGPYRQKECFGTEAKKALQNLVGSSTVFLQSDPSQANIDKYDRSLRYVFMSDGTHVGEYMVREGFAHEYTYSNRYQYQENFQQAEKLAQAEQKGLWAKGVCQGYNEEK